MVMSGMVYTLRSNGTRTNGLECLQVQLTVVMSGAVRKKSYRPQPCGGNRVGCHIWGNRR